MLKEKVEHSIKLLKTYEDVALSRCPKGYIVGYSGGKDSDAPALFKRDSNKNFLRGLFCEIFNLVYFRLCCFIFC